MLQIHLTLTGSGPACPYLICLEQGFNLPMQSQESLQDMTDTLTALYACIDENDLDLREAHRDIIEAIGVLLRERRFNVRDMAALRAMSDLMDTAIAYQEKRLHRLEQQAVALRTAGAE